MRSIRLVAAATLALLGGTAIAKTTVVYAGRVITDANKPALGPSTVVVTDVYAWKLLRRDRGLDVATTARRMRALVDAVLMPALTPAGTPAGTARSTPAQPSSATRSSAPPAPPPA